MPTPREGESRKDFVARCVPVVIDEGTAKDNDQAVAMCHSMFESVAVETLSEILPPGLTRLSEATFGDPARSMRVDREKCVIAGVKCLGRLSKNGRIYSDPALVDAGRLYEGIDVNLDHPAGDPNAERRMAEGFGVLRNVQVASDGVYADLHYLGSHPMAAVIAERAEKFPGNFGMSHNATGRVREDRQANKLVVEGLERVESVDIVRRPATNAGLFESESDSNQRRKVVSDDKTKLTKTVRQVLEAHPKDKRAAALLLLLEEEEFKTAGDALLESEGATPRDALSKLSADLYADKTLDGEALVKRAAKLMEAGTGWTPSSSGKPAAGNDPEKGTLQAAVKEAVEEALAPFKLQQAKHQLLKGRGLAESDLTAPQRKVFGRAESAQAAEDLLESWSVRPANASRPAIGARRDAGADADDDSLSYDQLKESVRPKAKATA